MLLPMKKILCLLPSLLIMAALSGCCANNVCNCNDALADALFFKINYTSHRQYDATRKATSFSANDVDTIRLSRTTRPPAGAKDTLSFVRTTESIIIARQREYRGSDTLIAATTTTNGGTTLINQDLIVINNASPFASTSTTKLSGYNYRIEVISNASGRRTPLATYYITRARLEGRFDANGCCTCYQNTSKSYRLTARSFQVDSLVATNNDTTGINKIVRLPFVPR